MTRATLGSANRTEVAKTFVKEAFFAEFAFPGGTIRVTTADRDITWGGFTWAASAVLRDYGAVSESSDLKARRTSLKLSGIDSTLLTRIFSDAYHYARVQLYVGYFTDSWALVADPYAFGDELLMSNCVLSVARGAGEVELSAETWDIFNQRDSAVLATPESQRLRYTGDTGMDRVAYITTLDVEWGGSTSRPGAVITPYVEAGSMGGADAIKGVKKMNGA